MFKVHLPHAQAILQSHSPSQVTLTNFNFSNPTSAGRPGIFDAISEIGYQSPLAFHITSEDQKVAQNNGYQHRLKAMYFVEVVLLTVLFASGLPETCCCAINWCLD